MVKDTVYPQIMPFPSTSFHCNIDGKKSVLGWNHCLWSLNVPEGSTWIFSGYRVSSHIPKMCMWSNMLYLDCPSLSECGCEHDAPCHGRMTCPSLGSRLAPWAAGRSSGHLRPLTEISRLENLYLVLINLS